MMRVALVCVTMAGLVALHDASSAGGNWSKLDVGGRSVDVFVPDCATRGSPMIVSLHAWFATQDMQEKTDTFSEYYNKETPSPGPECALLVYPEGEKRATSMKLGGFSWNAGGCCPGSSSPKSIGGKVPDVEFLGQVIDMTASTFKASEEHVFVVGVSNGGMMANRLACQDKRIKAIVSVAGPLVQGSADGFYDNFECSRRVPVLHIQGLADEIVPYGGCTGEEGPFTCKMLLKTIGRDGHDVSLPKTADYISDWRKRNGQRMTEAPVVNFVNGTSNCTSWGSASTNVTLCLMEKQGHAWPGRCTNLAKLFGSKCNFDLDASLEAMVFLKRYMTTTEGIIV